MRLALLAVLVACDGSAGNETFDAGPSFTFKANAYQRQGITSVTVDGQPATFESVEDSLPTFFFEEHFDSYADGVASPSRHVIFWTGDQIGIEGDLGPGACARSTCGGAATEEQIEIRWIDHFTRYDWDEVLRCTSAAGICNQIDG